MLKFIFNCFIKLIKFILFFNFNLLINFRCNILIERLNLTQFQEQKNQKHSRFLGMKSQRVTQYNSNTCLNSSQVATKYKLIKPNFNITLSLWCMFPSVVIIVRL